MPPSKAVKESALDFGFLRLVYSHARQARSERRTDGSADRGAGRLEQVIRDVAEGVGKALRAKRFLKGGAYDRGPRGSRRESSRVRQKQGSISVRKKKGNRRQHLKRGVSRGRKGKLGGSRHGRRGRGGSSEASGSGDESSEGSDKDEERDCKKGKDKGARRSSKLGADSKAGGRYTASAVGRGHQEKDKNRKATGARRLITDEANKVYFRRTLEEESGHFEASVSDGRDYGAIGRIHLSSADGVFCNQEGLADHSSKRSLVRRQGRVIPRPNARLRCFTLLEEGCHKIREDSSIGHIVTLDTLLRRVEPRVHEFRGLSVVFGHSLKCLLAACEERLCWGRDVDVIRDIQLYWVGDVKRYEDLKRRAMIEDRYDLLEQEVDYYRDRSSIVEEMEKLGRKRDIARQKGVLCPRTPRPCDGVTTQQDQSPCDLVTEDSYSHCDVGDGAINRPVRPPWARPPLYQRSTAAAKQSPHDSLVGHGLFGVVACDKAIGGSAAMSSQAAKGSCGLSSLWGNVYRTQNNRTGFCHYLS